MSAIGLVESLTRFVREVSSSTGLGHLNLQPSDNGFATFAERYGIPMLGRAKVRYFAIKGDIWEQGVGAVERTRGGDILHRELALRNSFGTTALVDFSAGIARVFDLDQLLTNRVELPQIRSHTTNAPSVVG